MKKYPFWEEPPCIGHYREFTSSPGLLPKDINCKKGGKLAMLVIKQVFFQLHVHWFAILWSIVNIDPEILINKTFV